ncbi:MAG: hypothetical protein ABIB65_01515 [Candidatus Margulisiibacteriota bacterium]
MTTEKAVLTRQERLDDLSGRSDKHRQNISEAGRQLAGFELSLRRAGEVQAQEIRNLRAKVVDMSAKGQMDALYKTANQGSLEQLRGNITKSKVFIAQETADMTAVEKQRQVILAEIESEEIDAMVKAACEKLKEFVAKYHELQPVYSELFELVDGVWDMDNKYFNRMPRLGYSTAFLVVFDSILKPGQKPYLNPIKLLDRISEVRDYGPPLIDKDRNFQRDVPLVRDREYNYFETK